MKTKIITMLTFIYLFCGVSVAINCPSGGTDGGRHYEDQPTRYFGGNQRIITYDPRKVVTEDFFFIHQFTYVDKCFLKDRLETIRENTVFAPKGTPSYVVTATVSSSWSFGVSGTLFNKLGIGGTYTWPGSIQLTLWHSLAQSGERHQAGEEAVLLDMDYSGEVLIRNDLLGTTTGPFMIDSEEVVYSGPFMYWDICDY